MGAPDAPDMVSTRVEENAAALLAYFLRRVEVTEDAADLLSDTLLVIWRQAERLPLDETEARMWMFGVARKVLLTHRRTDERRSALHEKLRSELSVLVPDEGGSASKVDVRTAIAELDELDQEIIRLTYWDGFSQAEAAHLLALPEGTVRSRSHRARQRLRLALPRLTVPTDA